MPASSRRPLFSLVMALCVLALLALLFTVTVIRHASPEDLARIFPHSGLGASAR